MNVIIRVALFISVFLIFISFYGFNIFAKDELPSFSVSSSSDDVSSDFPFTINFVSRNSGTSKVLLGVTYGNGMFVAVGWNSTILKSSDGVTWERINNSSIPNNEVLESVAYGNGKFIVVSASGKIWYSLDGDNWTKAKVPPATTSFTCVTYENSSFLACGNSDKILRSSDGLNWSSISTELTKWFYGEWFYGKWYRKGPPNLLYGVGYGNGYYVAVGERGRILTSIDLITWITEFSGTNKLLWSVGYGNNIFVVSGDKGTILTSDPNNVMKWHLRNSGVSENLRRVRYFNNTFFIVGWGGVVLSSTDGINWNSHNTGTTQNLLDIAYGNERLVVVGTNGTILTYP